MASARREYLESVTLEKLSKRRMFAEWSGIVDAKALRGSRQIAVMAGL